MQKVTLLLEQGILRIVQHVTSSFWSPWSEEVSPGLLCRRKWHQKGHNLKINDIVMICENTKIKGNYRLAIVEEVNTRTDGQFQSGTVRYSSVCTSLRGKEIVQAIRVKRSVQHLCLIHPVEEQPSSIVVKDH